MANFSLQKKNSNNILFIILIVIISFFISCQNSGNIEGETAKDTTNVIPLNVKKPIDSLSNEEIWNLFLQNPCYLPLLKDSNFWEKGTRVGFSFTELFNDSLSLNSPYRNRFLVGDFNAILPNGQNRKITELYPKLTELKEFEELPKELIYKIDTAKLGTYLAQDLIDELKTRLGSKAEKYINFINKVWKYKMVPISREYSIENKNIYSAGHTILLCEACKDTIKLIGKFATSPKRQDIAIRKTDDGNEIKSYIEYFPTGRRRNYYAGLYRITSKNWETQRKYDSLDVARDNELGGGNNRVTFFKGNAELPNFLLMQPDKSYPNAMRQNGIHEVALRGLSRGMLGTANSIGCLRVSDFGSKFLRWWVPQNCKLFISYNDTLYHKKIETKDSVSNYLPFKNKSEGDSFRKWINNYKPDEAKILEIGESGDYKNGYIIDGYYYFRIEYEKYLSNKNKTNEINQKF
jgi:hypothetical protein